MRGYRGFYSFLLHIFCLFYFPKILYALFFKGKYRKRKWLKINFTRKSKNSLIWAHAVSLGEIKAIAPLLKEFENQKLELLITCLTETGHAEATRLFPHAEIHFFPLDLPYVIGPIIKKISPDVILLSETDFWMNFLHFSKKIEAKIFLINGKMSERSFRRFSFFKSFAKQLFSFFDHFYLQSDEHASRFMRLGVPKTKVTVTGNIKMQVSFDLLTQEEKDNLRKSFHLKKEDIILTLGSTHDPEEKILLKQLTILLYKIPNLKIFLVPRHPERSVEVQRLLQNSGISYGTYSKKTTGKITLIDQTGLLRELYQISDVSFVGGSLTSKVGGHNIYEPLYCGSVTLFGSHMPSQREMRDLFNKYSCGIETTQEQLISHLEEILLSPKKREELNQKASNLVQFLKKNEEKNFSIRFKELNDYLEK